MDKYLEYLNANRDAERVNYAAQKSTLLLSLQGGLCMVHAQWITENLINTFSDFCTTSWTEIR